MALLMMLDQISQKIDNKKYSMGLFLYLSTAFDSNDHHILLQKLANYGIRGNALKWLSSYLSERTQCVSLGDIRSDFSTIRCGVPRGSVLDSLLFIIYINDIVNTSSVLNYVLFADDTNLFASHKNLGTLINILNKELDKVSNWLKVNKLSLNIKKTDFILFHNKQKLINTKINIG